ncbi:MAG: WXG100 family type VII secretion target [Bacilli bacterium]
MEVSAERMREIANELKEASARMEENLGNIKVLMEKVGEADIWSGTAANNAREEFDRLSAYFPNFYEAVINCSNGLNQFASNYDQAETNIISAMS